MDETITVNFDGGSRGNPGSAGIGVVLAAQDGTPLVTVGRYIGRATNNFAEYMALIVGLREAGKLGAKKILVRGDSELIIKQMRGEYRVKNPGLKDMHQQARAIADKFQEVRFEHNLRARNSLADRLANLAMDRKGDVTEITDESNGSPGEVGEIFSCPKCGCRIEIKEPSDSNDGHFICRCGTAME